MKYKEDFKGKRITVYGLGLHGGGVSTVRFLVEAGALVTVTDLKSYEQLLPSIEKLAPFEKNIRYVLGQHRSEDFIKADIVVKSPAIPWNDKYIRLSQENKIRIEMDSSIFFRYWNRPIIGVTGTKGKTTTALLTARILQMMGLDVLEVGIGQTPVLDALGKMRQNSVAVFELSSWRLSAFSETQMKKSPHIAIFKNFLPDHLNYYSTMEAYLRDKKNIFLYQKPTDWCLLNYDDPVLRDLQGEVKAQILWFGFSRPEGEKSIFIEQGWIVLDDGIDRKRIVATRELGLQGKHNILNATAAIGACWAYGVSLEKLKKRAKDVEGIPHRLEFIAEIRGVKYYNDTTATIPDATISALHSFTQPVILIAGGSNKGLNYEGFAKSVSHRTKNIVFLQGTATVDMKKALFEQIGERANTFPEESSMESALVRATSLAQSGDVIVLSPGAASFGMFQNEFDRGDQFRRIVHSLRKR